MISGGEEGSILLSTHLLIKCLIVCHSDGQILSGKLLLFHERSKHRFVLQLFLGTEASFVSEMYRSGPASAIRVPP